MKAHYITRHNTAVLRFHKALQHSKLAGSYTIIDATSRENLPQGAEGLRIPDWVLPKVDGNTLRKMRPDIMVIQGLTPSCANSFSKLTGQGRRQAVEKCTVHIFEIGYTSNTRYDSKLQEKAEQHKKLVEELKEEGWKVEFSTDHIVILGTAGLIQLSTKTLLKDTLEVSHEITEKTLCKLNEIAVRKGHDIITTRRKLEYGGKGLNQRNNPKRYRSHPG